MIRYRWLAAPLLALIWLFCLGVDGPGCNNGVTQPPGDVVLDMEGSLVIRIDEAAGMVSAESFLRGSASATEVGGIMGIYPYDPFRGETFTTDRLIRSFSFNDTRQSPVSIGNVSNIDLPVGRYQAVLFGTVTAGGNRLDRTWLREFQMTNCGPFGLIGQPLTLQGEPWRPFLEERTEFPIDYSLGKDVEGSVAVPPATVGEPYSWSLGALVTTGNTPAFFRIEDRDRDIGFRINPDTGVISGTPILGSEGSHFLVILVQDHCPSLRREMYVQVDIAVLAPGGCPALNFPAATLPNAGVGAAYTFDLTATGGSGAKTFALVSGDLPPGITLTGNRLQGTATTAGAFPFTLRVTDSCSPSQSREQSFTITVGTCPALSFISTSPLPAATVGTSYAHSLQGTGGVVPRSFALAATSLLPPGLTMTSGGVISGVPSIASSGGSFTVEMRDSCSPPQLITRSFQLDVMPVGACATLDITPTSLPGASVGIAYAVQLEAGGVAPLSWSVQPGAGSLPSGFTLSSAGRLEGTATAPFTSNFSIRVTDSCVPPQSDVQAFTLVATASSCAPPPQLQFTGFSDGDVGVPFSQQIPVSGGEGTLVVLRLSGNYPPGLGMTSGGLVLGTPTMAGIFTYTAQVVDSCPMQQSDTQDITITIKGPAGCPPLEANQPVLEQGTVGEFFSHGFEAFGGQGDIDFSISLSEPPPGLAIDGETGILSGIPTQAGDFQFLLVIFDECPEPQPLQFLVNLTINEP